MLSIDAWREAGAIVDHFAYALRSLCVLPDALALVVDSDDPLGPGQLLLCRRDELAAPCWSGPLLRGRRKANVQRRTLAPTGYADLLRMVGTFTTMIGWAEPRLVMGEQRMLISYVCNGMPGDEVLTPDAVRARLDAAFRRRRTRAGGETTDRAHALPHPEPIYVAVEPPAIPYARRLPVLGHYVARQARRLGYEPAELLIEELEGEQTLLAYRIGGGEQVMTVVDEATVRALCAERTRRRERDGAEALAALGARIDAANGRAISAHQRLRGDFVLSYTAHSGLGTVAARERIRESWALDRQRPFVDLARMS